MNDYLEHHGVKGMRWGVRRRRPQQVLGGDEYRRGLRRATLTTGLIGRAMYKRKYKTDDVAKPTAKVKRKSAVSDEYKKGLRRATLEGGLIGRAMYKKKNKPAAQPSVKKETKQVSHYTKDGKMKTHNTDSGITRQVKKDWNNLGDREFKQKYYTSKKTYAKRVEKYGDPYKHRTGNTDAAKAKAKKELAIDAEWKKKRGK